MLLDVGKKGHVKVLGGFSGVHGPAYEKLPAFLCPDGGFVSFFKGDVAHSLQCAAHQCLVHQGLFCFAPIAQQSHGPLRLGGGSLFVWVTPAAGNPVLVGEFGHFTHHEIYVIIQMQTTVSRWRAEDVGGAFSGIFYVHMNNIRHNFQFRELLIQCGQKSLRISFHTLLLLSPPGAVF